MRSRFYIFTGVCLAIHFFFMYYIITFNIIYEKSNESWIQSASLSLLIGWVVMDLGTPIIQGAIRALAMNFPKVR